MSYFKNHFGMVVSIVIALILSGCMSATSFFVDSLPFTLPAWIKGWGTSFLVIMLSTIFIPLVPWGAAMAQAFKRKPHTFSFSLVSNLIPAFFYNTFATFVAIAVNVFCNEHIPAEAQFSVFLHTSIHDWPIMFVVAYVLAVASEQLAVRIAAASVHPKAEEAYDLAKQ